MGVVHIFVIIIKKYLNSMTNNYNKGEISLGSMFFLIVVGLFILWVLTGRPSSQNNRIDRQQPIMINSFAQ